LDIKVFFAMPVSAGCAGTYPLYGCRPLRRYPSRAPAADLFPKLW